jgi:hypothetical protein
MDNVGWSEPLVSDMRITDNIEFPRASRDPNCGSQEIPLGVAAGHSWKVIKLGNDVHGTSPES